MDEIVEKPSKLLSIPVELRLQVCELVCRGSIVKFDWLYKKWNIELPTFAFVCKQLHREIKTVFWSEAELALPNCMYPVGCPAWEAFVEREGGHLLFLRQKMMDTLGRKCLVEPLSPERRGLVKHIWVALRSQRDGYLTGHTVKEISKFGNVRSLTVRLQTSDMKSHYPWGAPKPNRWTWSYWAIAFDVADRKKAAMVDFRKELPKSVTLFFELQIEMDCSEGMLVTADESCRRILKRCDTTVDKRTKQTLIDKVWSNEEMKSWGTLRHSIKEPKKARRRRWRFGGFKSYEEMKEVACVMQAGE